MGRQQSLPRGDAVNPLQRMLGTYLRLERTRLGYSSKEVANRLGLSDTYLRLAEAGRAALNQSLAFDLIEAFADSQSQTRDSGTISFARLALFMVGTHWVGAEMAANTKRRGRDAGRLAVEDLALRVADFNRFYDKTKRYFDLPDDHQKSFLEEFAAPEVATFLRSENYVPDPKGADMVSGTLLTMRDLLGLPTLNIEILLDLKQSLTGRSFVHTGDVAAQWESSRAAQFKSEHGVIARADLLLDQSNLNRFHFDHLFKTGFEELRFVFLNVTESADELTRIFFSRLNNGRRTAKKALLTSEEKNKVKFVSLSADQYELHKPAIDEVLSRDSKVHEAYWSFGTHGGLDIGFVGVKGDNADNTRNLNLRDAIHKAQLFAQVWDAFKR